MSKSSQHTPDQLVTAKWRESFCIAWAELPDHIQMPAPGKRMHKAGLLDAAIRLAAAAKPDGRLRGDDSFYGEELLAKALGVGLNKARGILRWFAAEGWLHILQTDSRRHSDERSLVIPPAAVVAQPGWPIVGSHSSSSGDHQITQDGGSPSSSSGNHHRAAVTQQVDGSPAHVDGSPAHVDGSRLNSTRDQPPGYPDTRKFNQVDGARSQSGQDVTLTEEQLDDFVEKDVSLQDVQREQGSNLIPFPAKPSSTAPASTEGVSVAQRVAFAVDDRVKTRHDGLGSVVFASKDSVGVQLDRDGRRRDYDPTTLCRLDEILAAKSS